MTWRLAVMGGGRMGEALVRGLLSSGWASPDQLLVVELQAERRRELTDLLTGVTMTEAAEPAEGVVLAVKPGDVEGACRQAVAAGAGRLLSIAAGVPLSKLEAWAGGVPVVRAMPNTPALVACGAAAISPGTAAGAEDLDWAEAVLSAVGTVERVPERLLDAVTGLSGSGPAYVYLVVEALVDAGVAAGLPRRVSRALVRQTVLGSARLLVESGEEPEFLRAAVTSPGGTTAAGLRVLESRAVRGAFLEAVAAATARSIELGRG
jgi:pyrroline-5-carboxylate reductase